ncbi:MAG: MBL fold metallo-hydrolase [Candidatus Hodarchaeota archaeon]
MFEYNAKKICWLGHDGFRWEGAGKVIIIDPFQLSEDPGKADIVIATHEHFDHCSPDDLPKVVGENTTIVAPPSCKDQVEKLGATNVFLKPGDETEIAGIKIKAVPAYNINKFREPGQPFHPKEAEHIGVLVTFGDGTTFYHTGDSDHIPAMKSLGKVDVGFIPVSGTYVMTAEEAIEATADINPAIAIPMHFGSIVGDENMAKKFKESVACRVEILEKGYFP